LKPKISPAQRGQALAEFAAVAVLAVMLAMLAVSVIPIHRAKTTAVTASYACAQFLSQSRDPAKAATNAAQIAQQIINQRWSGSGKSSFTVSVSTHGGAGQSGSCTVSYKVSTLFGFFGLSDYSGCFTAVSRSEKHKSLWK
jgi:Tfp pilus assembly protein FimT